MHEATAVNTSLLNQAHVQYQSGTGESTVEKTAKTQTTAYGWLAIKLEGLYSNSRSGGHEFESPMRRELGALTKGGKTLGVRFFLQFLSSQKSENKTLNKTHQIFPTLLLLFYICVLCPKVSHYL